jgi:hypothetical protein
MRTLLVAAIVLVAGLRIASSQEPPGGPPVYHGLLDITPAGHGVIDRTNGDATLTVHGWRYIVADDTNGLRPESERLIIAIGSGQNDLYLPPGALRPDRKARVFRYRAPRDAHDAMPQADPRIRFFRMARRSDGTYRVSFRVRGVELSSLNFNDPVCVPLAVIVGDDDGFATGDASSPTFNSRRVTLSSGICKAGWPWLGN